MSEIDVYDTKTKKQVIARSKREGAEVLFFLDIRRILHFKNLLLFNQVDTKECCDITHYKRRCFCIYTKCVNLLHKGF